MTPEARRDPRATARALATVTVVLVLAIAAFRFARATPTCTVTLPVQAAHPVETHDVASYRYGPTIVASSAMLGSLHHPAFLVDDVQRPTMMMKWVSATGDAAPYVALRFRRAHALERIDVHLAGTRETPLLDVKRASVRCLGAGFRPEGRAHAMRPEGSHMRQVLGCRAHGVRVDFDLSVDAVDVARIFEIEVLGR